MTSIRKKNSSTKIIFLLQRKKVKTQFKIRLGGNDTEKVYTPIYGDNERDEILSNLVKDFNLHIGVGNLLKIK